MMSNIINFLFFSFGLICAAYILVMFLYGMTCEIFSLSFGQDKEFVLSPQDKERINNIIHKAYGKNRNRQTSRSSGRKSRSKVPVDEYSVIQETPINNGPSTKEYVLPDGSKIQIDTEETQVTEETMFSRTVPEKLGGGMAEIIRKRREAEVF